MNLINGKIVENALIIASRLYEEQICKNLLKWPFKTKLLDNEKKSIQNDDRLKSNILNYDIGRGTLKFGVEYNLVMAVK